MVNADFISVLRFSGTIGYRSACKSVSRTILEGIIIQIGWWVSKVLVPTSSSVLFWLEGLVVLFVGYEIEPEEIDLFFALWIRKHTPNITVFGNKALGFASTDIGFGGQKKRLINLFFVLIEELVTFWFRTYA